MEIYYKEWAHLSMEAGMSQDLQGMSASGVPGELRAQVQFEGSRLKTQEELMFQFKPKGRNNSLTQGMVLLYELFRTTYWIRAHPH